MSYTELCDGCLFDYGCDSETCAQCKGQGISIGLCKGQGVEALTTIARTAILLSNILEEES